MSRLARLFGVLTRRSPLAWLLLGLVRAYRLAVSPLLGPRCRFEPSCGAYAEQALRSHGAVRGAWLTLRRLLRCHPWGGTGFDEVPPPRAARPPRATSAVPASRGASTRVDH